MTKIKSFGYYSVFICCLVIQLLGLDGFIDYYFWFPQVGIWQTHTEMITPFIYIVAILFAGSFLNIQRDDAYFLYCRAFIFSFGLLILFITPFKIVYNYGLGDYKFADIPAVITTVFVVSLGLRYAAKGSRPAVFLTVSFLFTAVGTIITLLSLANLIPNNEYSLNWLHLGALLEIVFASIGLGDKVRLIYKKNMQAEKESLRVEKQLRENEIESEKKKWHALATVANGFAHEINNPLAIIDGCARRLEMEGEHKPTDEEYKNMLEKIRAQVYRASKSISYLRDVTTGQRFAQNQRVNINHFVHEVVGDFSNSFDELEKRVEIQERIEWVAECHPKTLKEVIFELFKNAEEAGGRQVILRIEIDNCNGSPSLMIANNGPKIPMDIKERIFDPFFSSKEVGHEGKGLSSARKKIEEMGGLLFFDDQKPWVSFVIHLDLNQQKDSTRLAS